MTYYESWYEWAAEVLSPPVAGSPRAADSPPAAGSPTSTRRSAALGQFASILLDGIFMQMVVASPDFDLEAALEQAREALMHLIAREAGDQPESASPQRTLQDRR
jgi:hypothetical protein